MVLAQEESRLLKHKYIGTEHILLALIREDRGLAAQALKSFGVSYDSLRDKVVERLGPGDSPPFGNIPFTPRAKKCLEYALREALQLGHNYIGTEHILLGLLREGQGLGAQLLLQGDITEGSLRNRIMQELTAVAPTIGTESSDSSNCPQCKSSLATSARTHPLMLNAGDGPAVLAVYCGICGTHLAILRPDT